MPRAGPARQPVHGRGCIGHACSQSGGGGELYTEPYAASWGSNAQFAQLALFASAAQAALDAGLGVNAGHDLSLSNLATFVQQVPGVQEVSIGHALISDALEQGYSATVKAYLACIG